jgi:hypothetical protein
MSDAILWTMSEPMFVPAAILGLIVVVLVGARNLFPGDRDQFGQGKIE